MDDTRGKQIKSQLQKAVPALLKHLRIEREKSGGKDILVDDGEFLSVVLTMRRTPDAGKNKAIRIPIPHTLYDPDEGYQMCLFVKDKDVGTLKTRLEATPVDGLTKVIGLQKLRTDYQRYKDKRKLCDSYDLFLTDDSILPMMTKALGKEFFKKKKQPVSVRLTVNDLPKELGRARNATYMYLGYGTCISIRAARTTMAEEDIVANMYAAIDAAGEKVPKKWKNIQSIHIKTPQSVALPLYEKPLEDGSIYNGPALPGIIEEAAAVAAAEAVKKETKKETQKETKRPKKRKAEAKSDSAPVTDSKKSKTAKRKKK
jgi:ribosome biogenesis protein UTP30